MGLAKMIPLLEEFRLHILLTSCLVLIKKKKNDFVNYQLRDIWDFNHQFLTLSAELLE